MYVVSNISYITVLVITLYTMLIRLDFFVSLITVQFCYVRIHLFWSTGFYKILIGYLNRLFKQDDVVRTYDFIFGEDL